MMRDPKRIDRILHLVKTIWDKYPDLRLCQLLGNCFPAGDNYHREDDDLEERLKGAYATYTIQDKKGGKNESNRN